MNKTNFLLDVGIIFLFLLSSAPEFTGKEIHEWLSIFFGLVLLVHILIHWTWIVTIGKEYFKKTFHKSRVLFVLAVCLFLSFNVIIFSGLMMSKSFLPTLGIQPPQNFAWKFIHSASVNITLILVGLHFAFHWKWVIGTFKRLTSRPSASLKAVNNNANTSRYDLSGEK